MSSTGKKDMVVAQAYMQIILVKCLPMLEMTEKENMGSEVIASAKFLPIFLAVFPRRHPVAFFKYTVKCPLAIKPTVHTDLGDRKGQNEGALWIS